MDTRRNKFLSVNLDGLKRWFEYTNFINTGVFPLVIVILFFIGIMTANYFDNLAEEQNVAVVKNLETPPEGHFWTSVETKLPKGEIYSMDYAHDGGSGNHANNYVTVKLLTGELKIFRDIDEDLYLNLDVGDEIR